MDGWEDENEREKRIGERRGKCGRDIVRKRQERREERGRKKGREERKILS